MLDIPIPAAVVSRPVDIDSKFIHVEFSGELHLAECWFTCDNGVYRITIYGESADGWESRNALVMCRDWLELTGEIVALADALRANLEGA